MSVITPTPITALPPAPVKGQAGFNAAVELYLSALVNPFTPQVNAAIAATNANALSAEQSAITAQAAAAGIDAPVWTSGDNYQVGRSVKSPLAIAAGASPVYICKVAISGGTTDPYNDPAHWSIFTVSGGVGGAVYTTSTTLTASSPFAISISGGAGVWLKLPNATTLSTGIRHTVRNTGDNDLTLIDASGAHIGFIRAQCGTTIALSDNATAAGKWAGDWEQVGITADLQFGAAIAGLQNVKQIVQLDSTRTMILTGGSSGQGLYAVVYDTATQSAGAAVLVRAAAHGSTAVKSETDQVLCVAWDNGNPGNLYATVLTVAGTSITVNTAVTAAITGQFVGVGNWASVNGAWCFSYNNASYGIARAITISGTTPSIGAEQSAAASGAPRLYVSGAILRVVRVSNASTVICTPYSVSGGTLTTAGTAASTPTNMQHSKIRTFLSSGGNIICLHNTGGFFVVSIFKLSGTTESQLSANLCPSNDLNLSNMQEFAIDFSVAKNNKIITANVIDSTYASIAFNCFSDNNGSPVVGTYVQVTCSGFFAFHELKSSKSNEAAFLVQGSSSVFTLSFDCSGQSLSRKSTNQLYKKISGRLPTGFSKDVYGLLNGFVCSNDSMIFIISAFDSASSLSTPVYGISSNRIYIPSQVVIKANASVRDGNYSTWVVSQIELDLGVSLQRVEVAQI